MILSPAVPIINVKQALATILAGKNLVGLLVTGFDDDHFCEVGIKTVMNKYRPNWVAYPLLSPALYRRHPRKVSTAPAFSGITKATRL